MKKLNYIFAILILFFSAQLKAQTDVKLTYLNQFDVSSTGSITLLPGFWVQEGFSFRAHIVDSATSINPSVNKNYILTYTALKPNLWTGTIPDPGVKDVRASIQYLDNLGRPDQEIEIKGSASFRDIVTPHQYTLSGREEIKYLPYVEYPKYSPKPYDVGVYRPDAVNSVINYYYSPPRGYANATEASTYKPFAVSKFENSPLSRIKEQGSFGDSWQPADQTYNGAEYGHTIKFEERSLNTSTAVKMKVSINLTTGARTLVHQGYYNSPPDALSVKIVKDENWTTARGDTGVVMEYTNPEGQIILKRRSFNNNGSLDYTNTYYVYDDFGNLSFVLPPKFEPTASNVGNQNLLNELCYQYKYDGRQRLIEKRIPGQDWQYMVYNKLDQVVAAQDANQHLNNQWLFSKYDVFGRPIVTGIFASSIDRATFQTNVDSQTIDLWEVKDNAAAMGYSNTILPNTNLTYLSANYYDDYNFPGGNPYPDALASEARRGTLTGTKTNVLGTTDFLWSVTYYDSEGRIAKNYKQHYKGGVLNTGNYDVVSNTYNFTGQVLSADRRHVIANTESLKVLMEYEYNSLSQLTKTWETLNNTKVLLSSLEYDDFGKITDKMIHSTDANASVFLDTVTTSYDIKNRPNYVHSWRFSYGLNYGYDANIKQFDYSSAHTEGLFAYTYDDLGRLTKSNYFAGNYPSVDVADFDETIAYDKNGNITSLNRGGVGNGLLNYYYSNGEQSNKLSSVSKNSNSFRSYTYDANGNANGDGMGKSIIYNLLNLPTEIRSNNNQLVSAYTYSANGEKLRKVGPDGNRDYIGGIVYFNDVFEQIQTPEGKAIKNGADYHFVYDLKDHLGNVRVSIDSYNNAPRVIQEDEYYAFGLHKLKLDNSNSNKYLYNGKELQEELGQYDYGARFYDPVIGRWNTVDPLAETSRRFSPYVYGNNNPIRFIDPDGMASMLFDDYVFDQNGNFKRVDENNNPDKLVMEFVDDRKDMTITTKVYYNFNDPETDTQAIKNAIASKGKVGVNQVDFLGDEKIERLIKGSGVRSSEAQESPMIYAKAQGENKMDYGVNGIKSGEFNPKSFYIRDGKAYNVGDIGNYLWGRGMAELKISLPTALMGADYNNIRNGKKQKTTLYNMGPGTYGSAGFFDSREDQRAITNGYYSYPKQKTINNNKTELSTKSIYLN